jgi:hypothetical protein
MAGIDIARPAGQSVLGGTGTQAIHTAPRPGVNHYAAHSFRSCHSGLCVKMYICMAIADRSVVGGVYELTTLLTKLIYYVFMGS